MRGWACHAEPMVASERQFEAATETRPVDERERNRIQPREPVEHLLAVPREGRAIGRVGEAHYRRGMNPRAESCRNRGADHQYVNKRGRGNRAERRVEFAQAGEVKRVRRLTREAEPERGGPVVGGHPDVPRLE